MILYHDLRYLKVVFSNDTNAASKKSQLHVVKEAYRIGDEEMVSTKFSLQNVAPSESSNRMNRLRSKLQLNVFEVSGNRVHGKISLVARIAWF